MIAKKTMDGFEPCMSVKREIEDIDWFIMGYQYSLCVHIYLWS